MSGTTTVARKRGTGKTLLEPTGKETAGKYRAPKLEIPVTPARDHIEGLVNASLTLVEYGDYQCPYCGAAYPEVKRVQKELGSELRFVFRNFPLTNIHEHAMNAAETAEAASAQESSGRCMTFSTNTKQPSATRSSPSATQRSWAWTVKSWSVRLLKTCIRNGSRTTSWVG